LFFASKITKQKSAVPTEERQLAAIMFTDMVGYSAMAQKDEALALELLEEHRRIVREVLARFHGIEIKRSGTLSCSNSAAPSKRCNVRSKFSGRSPSAITMSRASVESN
jgi:class 3 adenylate cyclase